MDQQRKATLLGLSAVLLWSTVATAFKLALRHLDVPQLLFLANIFSTLALALVLTTGRKWSDLCGARRGDLARAAGLGLLNPLLYYLILFRAYDLLPAQVAQPLNYTWALMLAYLSVPLLGHRLRGKDIVAGLVCYAGVVVIATGGDVSGFRYADPLGVALALVSTVVWALYWIAGRRSAMDPVAGLFTGFMAALPFTAAVVALRSDFSFAGAGVLGAAYVGCIEMGFTFVLWLMALRLTTATARIANLIFLSPFLSLVFIRFVLGENIRPTTPAGLILIVAGLLWQARTADAQASRDQR